MNIDQPGFDRRWLELARTARTGPRAEPFALEIARRARRREPEALPLVSARSAWWCGIAAAVVTCFLAPLAFERVELPPTVVDLSPPDLPPPPSLESPSYYLARAGAAWKELTP